MARLLIVEDDKKTNEAICEYLRSAGHEVIPAYDGGQALDMMSGHQINLAVLDIMIPKVTGIMVLHQIRKTSDIPVLMLTAMDDEFTQVKSFDKLADDYITKPFSMLLLGKRVTALLRRSGNSAEIKQVQFGGITVDFSGYTAFDQSGKLEVTPKELDLLKLLIEHKGLVLTRQQILDEVWGFDYPIIDRTIDTYIKNLRKKLRLDCIITVKGVGYKYEEPK